MSWHIEDWASSEVKFNGQRFDSFEEARDFISEVAEKEADRTIGYHRTGSDEWEEVYNGICEDLYAIEDEEESKQS